MAIERVNTYFKQYGMEQKIQEFVVAAGDAKLEKEMKGYGRV